MDAHGTHIPTLARLSNCFKALFSCPWASRTRVKGGPCHLREPTLLEDVVREIRLLCVEACSKCSVEASVWK